MPTTDLTAPEWVALRDRVASKIGGLLPLRTSMTDVAGAVLDLIETDYTISSNGPEAVPDAVVTAETNLPEEANHD